MIPPPELRVMVVLRASGMAIELRNGEILMLEMSEGGLVMLDPCSAKFWSDDDDPEASMPIAERMSAPGWAVPLERKP